MINFNPFPTLLTERLILRNLSIDDSNDLLTLRTDENVNKYIIRPEQPDIETFILGIHKRIAENVSIYWVISVKEDAKLIGTICLWNISSDGTTGEVGYALNPDSQGKGFMNEALNAVITYGLKSMGLKTIEAYTHKDNRASIKLLEKNGFKADKNRIDEENLSNLIFSLNAISYGVI